jgi:hypothetical protein
MSVKMCTQLIFFSCTDLVIKQKTEGPTASTQD